VTSLTSVPIPTAQGRSHSPASISCASALERWAISSGPAQPWEYPSRPNSACESNSSQLAHSRDGGARYGAVALQLNPGFGAYTYQQLSGFNCNFIVLKSRIRVLKLRTKLRLKFVRVLSAVQRAESAKAPAHISLFETRSVRDLCAVRPSFSGI
jgi:hypothetical protein